MPQTSESRDNVTTYVSGQRLYLEVHGGLRDDARQRLKAGRKDDRGNGADQIRPYYGYQIKN